MSNKKAKGQEQRALNDYGKIERALVDLTSLTEKLIQAVNKPMHDNEDIKLGLETLKATQSYLRFKVEHPIIYTMLIKSMTPEQMTFAKENINLIKKGE